MSISILWVLMALVFLDDANDTKSGWSLVLETVVGSGIFSLCFALFVSSVASGRHALCDTLLFRSVNGQ